MMDEAKITINAIYGTVESRSWSEVSPDGDRLIGMGMTIFRDRDGKITEVKVEPTGCVLILARSVWYCDPPSLWSKVVGMFTEAKPPRS